MAVSGSNRNLYFIDCPGNNFNVPQLLTRCRSVSRKKGTNEKKGVVEQRDTDRSEGKDTGSNRKERFSLFLLSHDFHRVLGVRLGLG